MCRVFGDLRANLHSLILARCWIAESNQWTIDFASRLATQFNSSSFVNYHDALYVFLCTRSHQVIQFFDIHIHWCAWFHFWFFEWQSSHCNITKMYNLTFSLATCRFFNMFMIVSFIDAKQFLIVYSLGQWRLVFLSQLHLKAWTHCSHFVPIILLLLLFYFFLLNSWSNIQNQIVRF